MRRVIWILLPLILSLSAIKLALSTIHPKLEAFVLSQIKSFADQKLPFQLEVGGFDYHFVLPQIKLQDVRISSDEAQVSIKQIRANLDIFGLLTGKLALSGLVVESPVIKLNFNLDKSSDINFSTQMVFNVLKSLPIYQLAIVDGSLETPYSSSRSLALVAYNHKDRLRVQMQASNSVHTKPYQVDGVNLELEFVMTSNNLELTRLKLLKDESVFTSSGFLTDLKDFPKKHKGSFVYNLKVDTGAIPLPPSIPRLTGKIDNSGKVEITGSSISSSGGKTTAKDLSVAAYPIGNLDFEYNYQNNTLALEQLHLDSPSGTADLKNLNLKFIQDPSLSVSATSEVTIKDLDLRTLLRNLKVGDIPVELDINGKFDCSGILYPDFSIRCPGSVQGRDLLVWDHSPKQPIIAVENIKGNGEVEVNNQSVKYKTKVIVGKSQGESDGIIDYKKGFYINFSTPELAFSDIKDLAGLKLEGSTSLDGFTSGNSKTAQVHTQFGGKNIVLDDFLLGYPTGACTFESGKLNFDKVNGTLASSPYQADVEIDIYKSHIKASGESQKFQVEDLSKAFQKHLAPPVEITGTGDFKLSAEGPLKFSELSYQLDGTVRTGTIAGESFDQLVVSVTSDKGEVQAKKVILNKGQSTIELTGQAHPNGQIDFRVLGNQLQLAESENIAKLGGNIGGYLDFVLALTGPIGDPETQLKANLRQLFVEDQEFPDSLAALKFTKQHVEGNVNFFGNRLKTEFAIPYDETSPFHLKMSANKWNYASVFTLIGGGSILNEYEASLSGNLELNSERGGLFSATGKGVIHELLLKRGALSVHNTQPMELTMKDGVANLSHVSLEGDGSYLDVSGANFSKNNLALKISGKTNLRLLQIFLPFLDDLGGQIDLAVLMSGSLMKPQILGKAHLEQAFAKLKGFPHVFERINSEIDFSQHRISISNLTGHLAGGTLTGSGSISIEGLKDYPTEILFKLDGANLNVPEQVRTAGSASLALSGHWFPFLLSGDYIITSGLIDKEFQGDSLSSGPRQSAYLPKMILQSAFEPLVLDIKVHMAKPLQLKNSIGDGLLTGQMDVRGNVSNPIPLGKITLEKGFKLFFRDQAFEVISGNLQFTNPNEINPNIYVTAHSRVSEYDINMVVQGNSKQPEIRLSSTPPLAEQEIISLLALGMTSEDLAKSSQQKEQENISYQVGTAILSSSPVTKGLQKSLGVKIEVSNSFDDTKNVSIPKVKVSRSLNKKIQVSASQTLNEQSDVEIKAHYSLDKNLSTVLSYERRSGLESSAKSSNLQSENTNILGLDLEFSREFK